VSASHAMQHCFVLPKRLCMICPGVAGVSVCQCFPIGTVGMHDMHSLQFHESLPVRGVRSTEASEKKEDSFHQTSEHAGQQEGADV
jgi:hypothetical protein